MPGNSPYISRYLLRNLTAADKSPCAFAIATFLLWIICMVGVGLRLSMLHFSRNNNKYMPAKERKYKKKPTN